MVVAGKVVTRRVVREELVNEWDGPDAKDLALANLLLADVEPGGVLEIAGQTVWRPGCREKLGRRLLVQKKTDGSLHLQAIDEIWTPVLRLKNRMDCCLLAKMKNIVVGFDPMI